MEPARDRVVSRARLAERLRAWRAAGERIVLADGAFDLLRLEHARVLATARTRGTRLAVIVHDDASVAARWGAGHPVVAAADRALLVAALRGVDLVALGTVGDASALAADLAPLVRVPDADAGAGETAARVRRLHAGG